VLTLALVQLCRGVFVIQLYEDSKRMFVWYVLSYIFTRHKTTYRHILLIVEMTTQTKFCPQQS